MESEFEACLKAVSLVCEEIAPLVEEKLEVALLPLGVFHVRVSTGSDPLGIYIEDASSHHLSGSVSLEYTRGMWGTPFKPTSSPHPCDKEPHAGRYVLSAVESKSYVGTPAMSCDHFQALDALSRSLAFTRVVGDARLYLDTLLRLRTGEVGSTFLKRLK